MLLLFLLLLLRLLLPLPLILHLLLVFVFTVVLRCFCSCSCFCCCFCFCSVRRLVVRLRQRRHAFIPTSARLAGVASMAGIALFGCAGLVAWQGSPMRMGKHAGVGGSAFSTRRMTIQMSRRSSRLASLLHLLRGPESWARLHRLLNTAKAK